MEVGLVHKIDIDSEMQQAYLDYAMSVIVARALPDARDGLKPVHRRILYAMHDMGIRPDTPYKKSARIVGEVLGKYHPHGDMAVYDAMARMAQDFSMRYMLVDGQGNFGSVDGDPPAAMRYTEARLASPAGQMLADIQKNTVDFNDNFDGTLQEPSVLPSAIPNMLVNGATGIAVGMATSIPPHNLNEIVAGMQYVLENWDRLDDIGIEDLLNFVQGPDFPTGGLLVQSAEGDGLVTAYSTGRGQVTIQARAHLEEMERGRSRIIVTELPYMTNKSSLIERIADLVREERLEGIADLRDESDRQGMRIVIELSKTADPEKVLHSLLKHTPMQTTFSIIMLALLDGEPRMLSLKQAMRAYLEHRLEIVRRRSQYDLDRAKARAHILEGLRVALKNLDEVIEIIRKSPDVDTARARLMKRYKLSEIQTQAILDMPLRRLAALERKKIEEEYKETQALIKELEGLLRSPKKMRQVVGDELNAIKAQYGDRRRTHILRLKAGQTTASLLTAAETVPDKTAWLSVTANGLISRTHDDSLPALSGAEAPAWLIKVSSRDTLYLVAENGEAAALPVHAVPESATPLEGAPLHKVSAFREGSPLAAAFSVPPRAGREEELPEGEPRYILTATRQGMVKKSALSELPGPSANLFALARVNEGDRLGWATITHGKNELLLLTADGMAIRFSEDEVRPMGLVAAGVMGIKLGAGDEICALVHLPQPGDVLLVADSGKGKRVPVDHFPVQGRYGQGVQAWKLGPGEKIAGAAIGKSASPVTVHTSRLQPRAIRLDAAPLQNRAAKGQAIRDLKDGDRITRLTQAWSSLFRVNDAPPTAAAQSNGEPKATRKPATAKAAAKPPAKTAAAKTAAKPAAKPAASKDGAAKSAPKTAKSAAHPAVKATKTAAQPEKPAASKPSVQSKAAPAKSAPTKAASNDAQPPTAAPKSGKAAAAPAKATPTKSVPKSAAKPAAKPAAKASPAAPPKSGRGSVKPSEKAGTQRAEKPAKASAAAKKTASAPKKPAKTPVVTKKTTPAAEKPAAKKSGKPTAQPVEASKPAKPAAKKGKFSPEAADGGKPAAKPKTSTTTQPTLPLIPPAPKKKP